MWERRVPLIPADVAELIAQGVGVVVQPAKHRVFTDDEYRAVGAAVSEDLSGCSVVFGVKEMPEVFFREGQGYVFFSHTIKGQPENMSMLKRLMELNCQLIDYERVQDEGGKRLIFFGWHAGVAGMVETLVAVGRRSRAQGTVSPFAALHQPHRYASLDEIRRALTSVAGDIREHGIPDALRPFVVAITGYGNVSQGAQEMLDLLPTHVIAPGDVATITRETSGARDTIFKAVFKEKDLVKHRERPGRFDLQHYYNHPEDYVGVFEGYLPNVSVLVNCMYWDARYPRLVTKDFLRRRWRQSRLIVIGDIGCDIGGAVEATYKATEPGAPSYVYEPSTDTFVDGEIGDGPVIMAVDILPSELPRDASIHFSNTIKPFVQPIANADYNASGGQPELPDAIRRALVLHRGRLTPDYAYLASHLD